MMRRPDGGCWGVSDISGRQRSKEGGMVVRVWCVWQDPGESDARKIGWGQNSTSHEGFGACVCACVSVSKSIF